MSTDFNPAFMDQKLDAIGRGPESVIPILQAIQTEYGYLPSEALEYIAENSDISPASIDGVSTFYSQFRRSPVGKHMISVCRGTACHVKGAGMVQKAFEWRLGVPEGGDTDPDGLFTVEEVACLGCCTLAPVIQIDGITYGHLTATMIPEVLDDFMSRADQGEGERPDIVLPDGERAEIRIGLGSCCQAQGSGEVMQALQGVLGQTAIPAEVKQVGCVGMCHQTPLLEIVSPGGESSLYAKVKAGDVEDIVIDRLRPRTPIDRIKRAATKCLDRLFSDETDSPTLTRHIDPQEGPVCAFLGPQLHVAMEGCGRIDPTNYDEYVQENSGFAVLRRAIEKLSQDEIIAEVLNSGARGRGGAGFPTGRKWEAVKKAQGAQKYIICNGDEGDPGAFMDRMLLESFPYRVLEGMAIAARAVGATKGYLYIRAEYPLALKRVRDALERCYKEGILGPSVMGSDFSLELSIKEGAGAFVCGEETALLESIEGRRGMPRLRPPFPAESGLYGCPTLVNNVETYSLVPWILRQGSERFAQLGTEHSKGTKVFSLAGKVRRGGLIEVPMGITIRQIVDEIGGGVAHDRKLKAVQIGGPSGGCVPVELADTTVDFEALQDVGAIMGSGGLVVLDERDCMVDIARYFLQFTQEQSCGKCTFCRVGTRRMLDILDRLCRGEGKPEDLDDLETLAHTVRSASLCGLGKTAPNPIISTLRYFRDEYEAHLEGRCPAGKCPDLISYKINEKCNGCTLCAQSCPTSAIPATPYQRHQVNRDACVRCDTCREVCPYDAVYVE
jgi:NADH-quinone oxidoreductase subunit F